MASFVLGKDAKLILYGSNNQATELTNVTDATIDFNKDKADVTTRGSGSWRSYKGTLKEATLSFSSIFGADDPTYGALMTSFLEDTEVTLAALTGTNGIGPKAEWSVTKATRNEKLTEAITIDFELSMTKYLSWETGSSSGSGSQSGSGGNGTPE